MFKEFLGKNELELVKYTKLSENVVIAGIKGVGTSTLIKGLLEHFENSDFVPISLFPTETDEHPSNKILEELLLSKISSNKKFESISKLINSKEFEKKKLVVAVNKIHLFKNPSDVLNFFENIRKLSFRKIVLIISCDLEFYYKFPAMSGMHKFIFCGFKEKYNELIKSFCDNYQIEKMGQEITDELQKLSSSHTAITKSLMFNYKIGNNLSDLDLLFKKDSDLVDRIKLVFESIQKAQINISDFGDKTAIKKYEDLGLVLNGKYGEVFLFYYKKFLFAEKNIEEDLSKTEMVIYDFLNKNVGKVAEIDQIIDYLESVGKEFELSNWTIYKHINNINKKLKTSGIKIENIRGKGYKLIKTN